MKANGWGWVELYSPGDRIICQPMNGSSFRIGDREYIPSESPCGAEIMPCINEGDEVELVIPSGSLKISARRIEVRACRNDDQTLVQRVEGETRWDGAYNALQQGASGVGDFFVDVRPHSFITTSAWPEPIPMCVYQTARIAAGAVEERVWNNRQEFDSIDWTLEGRRMEHFIREVLESILPIVKSW